MMYDESTTCAQVLAAWDSGDSIWSVEMGGLGPGYEQAIQVLAMECMRKLVTEAFVYGDDDKGNSVKVRALLDPVVSEVDKWPGCGFSGAQAGAAMNLACFFHRHGPHAAVQKADPDRRIQVSREWPRQP